MNQIFNKAEYKPRRQALRGKMTEPEKSYGKSCAVNKWA